MTEISTVHQQIIYTGSGIAMKVKQNTLKALQLVAEGKTHYMAAKMSGIAQSTVKRAIERQKTACPVCGKPQSISEVK